MEKIVKKSLGRKNYYTNGRFPYAIYTTLSGIRVEGLLKK